MKSIGKIVGILLLVLLLIVVGLGFALTQLIDPNDYKSEIQDLAREKANIELKLSGEIGWSLFPWLGLSLHQASIAATQTPEKPFARLDMLGISVRLLPLLRREVQMSAIRAEGLTLTLERDARGKGNWEGVGHQGSKNSPPARRDSEKISTPPPGKTSQPLTIDIDSLIINNGRIDYFDAGSNLRYSAESLQLTSGRIRDGASIPLKLSAFISGNQPVLRASCELSANLRMDIAAGLYQLENTRLSGELSGAPFADKSADLALQGQLLFDQKAQRAQWNNLKLSLNQLRASGELAVSQWNGTPVIDGQITLTEFDLARLLTGLGHKPPPMGDAGSLKKASLSSQVKTTKTGIALENLDIHLDGSHFNGRLELADFSTRALRVQLVGDKLNLDRYLPPPAQNNHRTGTEKTAAGNADSPAAGQSPWSDEPIFSPAALRDLDFVVELTLDRLTAGKIPLDKVRLKATATGGLLGLQSFKAGLYDGSLDADASLDVREVQPMLAARFKMVDVPVERLLEKNGQTSPLSGALTLNADIKSRGNSQRAWMEALHGKADFLVKNGVLPDANLEQQLCQGIALLNRKTLSQQPRSKDTPFEQLSGSFTLASGVATNPDLSVRIPGLSFKGNGRFTLPLLTMDYHLGLLIEGDTRENPDPACAVNPRYVGMELPVRCRGSLESASKACRLDKNGVTQMAARLLSDKYADRVEKKLDKVIEKKLGADSAPEIKDALRGLLKR